MKLRELSKRSLLPEQLGVSERSLDPKVEGWTSPRDVNPQFPWEVPLLRSYVKFLEEHTNVSLESAAEDSLKVWGGKQGSLGMKVDLIVEN